MPFSKRQIDRILDLDGKPVIPQGAQNNLSIQVTESFIRRRLFRLEDETVLVLFNAYKRAFADMRTMALNMADAAGVGNTLSGDGHSLLFKQNYIEAIRPRIDALTDEVALKSFEAAQMAWLGSYYGRLWGLDSATVEDFKIKTPLPARTSVARAVIRVGLREQVDESLVLELLGREWRAQYAIELDNLVLRITRSLNGSIDDGLGMRAAMRRVADVMGVSTDRRRVVGNTRANFNRIQAITRTSIQESVTRGALEGYEQNADIINAVEFLETLDDRVCAICDRRRGGLGGTVWPLGSPKIRRPPVHVNCRCDLIPIVDTNIMVDDDQPPGNTFIEFMTGPGVGIALGIYELLDQFVFGRKKDSSRIGDD